MDRLKIGGKPGTNRCVRAESELEHAERRGDREDTVAVHLKTATGDGHADAPKHIWVIRSPV